jgi:hypothetical protein
MLVLRAKRHAPAGHLGAYVTKRITIKARATVRQTKSKTSITNQ